MNAEVIWYHPERERVILVEKRYLIFFKVYYIDQGKGYVPNMPLHFPEVLENRGWVKIGEL